MAYRYSEKYFGFSGLQRGEKEVWLYLGELFYELACLKVSKYAVSNIEPLFDYCT